MEDARGRSCVNIDQVKMIIPNELDEDTTEPYRQLIGCLQYIANFTRPDIQYATNFMARFNSNPKDKHWKATLDILRYLKETMDAGINYEGAMAGSSIGVFSDADWGRLPHDRHSTSGCIVLMASAPITFFARRQKMVAASSTEAEYVAASEAVKEIKWLRNLMMEIGLIPKEITLHVDNQSAIRQIKNVDTNKRSKHVDIRYHSIREAFEEKEFQIKYIPTGNQAADILTKLVNGPRLDKILKQCGIY